MTYDQIVYLVGGALLLLLFGIGIPFVIKDIKKNKDKYVFGRKSVRMEEDKLLDDMGERFTSYAEVVDMACGVSSEGCSNFKMPRAEIYFIISFKTESGEVLKVSVPEEVYEGFDIGLCGTLTLIDGELYSFEPDI